MKTSLKNIVLVVLLSALPIIASTQCFAKEDGYFKTTYIGDSYSYYNKTPSVLALTKFILPNVKHHIGKANWDQKKRIEYSSLLAQRILKISQCLDFDPIVFAALIREESHFDNKRQNRKANGEGSSAVGFGQTLHAAIKEINDQFSMPDLNGKIGSIPSRARIDAREYFQDTIRTCFEPELKIKHFVHLWERADVKKHPLYSPEWFNAARTQIINDDVLSLIISASVLKVYYSVVKTNDVKNEEERKPKLTKDEFLKKILQTYGEPNDEYVTKVIAAANELRKL